MLETVTLIPSVEPRRKAAMPNSNFTIALMDIYLAEEVACMCKSGVYPPAPQAHLRVAFGTCALIRPNTEVVTPVLPHHPMTQLHVCENGVAVRKWCGGMGVRHGLGSRIGALTGGRPSASDLPQKSSRAPILHSHRSMAAALLPSQDGLHLTPSRKT